MSNTLAPPTTPFDIEVLDGITFTVDPVSDFEWLVIKNEVASQLDNLASSVANLENIGLSYIADYDHNNKDHVKALNQLLLGRALAVKKIKAWKGIVDEATGEPVPVTAENILAIMKDWVFASRFYELLTKHYVLRALAKKKFTTGAAGTSSQAPARLTATGA